MKARLYIQDQMIQNLQQELVEVKKQSDAAMDLTGANATEIEELKQMMTKFKRLRKESEAQDDFEETPAPPIEEEVVAMPPKEEEEIEPAIAEEVEDTQASAIE